MPWMVAIVHNNLANANRELGDVPAARQSYAASLEAYRDYDDKWAMAFLIEDIAVLASVVGESERALMMLGAAETLREAIGAPRSPSLAEGLEGSTAPAKAALGEHAAAAVSAGRALDQAQMVALALEFCSG